MKTAHLLCLVSISLFTVAQPIRASTMPESACRSPEPAEHEDMVVKKPATQKDIFMHSYEVAECLRRLASAKGVEWLETEGLLVRSLQEADKGNWETASGLVKKAHFQADAALQQAEYEAGAWKQRVVD